MNNICYLTEKGFYAWLIIYWIISATALLIDQFLSYDALLLLGLIFYMLGIVATLILIINCICNRHVEQTL